MPVEALFDIAEPGETRVKDKCKGRAIGIDLGTTNSLVAAVQAGQPVCFKDEQGDTLLPSVVHYAADGSVVVGREARDRHAPLHPRSTIASVKRFMGRGPADAEATRRMTPYELDGSSPGVVRFKVQGREPVSPIEVSAEILRVLKHRAEAELGGELEGAVITVPAYFDDAQRQATRDAGRLAGLEVMRLLNEPTAAALAYGLDKQAEGTFAVFDLGGGTFDISILKLQGGVFEVKSTGGDSALGGDDFDRAVAAHLLHEMGLPADGGGDRKLVRRTLDAARAVKEALTTAESAEARLELADGSSAAVTVTRKLLDTLVVPVLDRCAAPVRRALRDAAVDAAALSGVILVGGATRMPVVRSFVKELFGREPLADIDPDEVVALGAAIQADLLAGDPREDVLLLDVVPLSLGIETMGGVVERLIHRNTTIPCGAQQVFTTFADNQTGFDVHVVQGERELVADCRSLARFTLRGIPPMPAGLARLEVTFLVDADGILRVMAREQKTGQEASITVKPSYGLSDEEVERMLLDSFSHAEDDVKNRFVIEQRVEADRILAATRHALAETPELVDAGERDAIEKVMAELDRAKAGTDHHVIRGTIELLEAATNEFAKRRMNRALDQGLRGRGVGEVDQKLGGPQPTEKAG